MPHDKTLKTLKLLRSTDDDRRRFYFMSPITKSAQLRTGMCAQSSWHHTERLRHRTFWIGSTCDGQSWLAFLVQVCSGKVWNTTHSGAGVRMGTMQVWSTTHQQLWVPDLPPDVSFTDRASCPQQVPLASMAESTVQSTP